MKLLVLGGTGATGTLLVERALAAGHDVTALVRDAAAVARRDKLRVEQGRATVAAELAAVVAGHDAVVSTIGPRKGDDPVCADTAAALMPAMKQHGVRRLVWLSASGVGDSRQTMNRTSFVFGRIIIPLFLKKPYASHARAEATVSAGELDWTIVRPVRLVAKPGGKPVQATLPSEPVGGTTITRGEVAEWMLAEVTARGFVGKLPLLWT